MAPERFIGGLSVPSRRWGRLNASVPLVVLILETDNMRTALRGPGSGVEAFALSVPLSEVSWAFRLSGRVMSSGVGFELTDGRILYFWAGRDKERLIEALARRGVAMSGVARPASEAFQLRWSRRKR